MTTCHMTLLPVQDVPCLTSASAIRTYIFLTFITGLPTMQSLHLPSHAAALREGYVRQATRCDWPGPGPTSVVNSLAAAPQRFHRAPSSPKTIPPLVRSRKPFLAF